MAFDLTKPSMSAGNWSAALGDIRENFRAIVHGDDNVFTKSSGSLIFRIRSLDNTAAFDAWSGNGTTSNRFAYFRSFANETAPQDWIAGMFGTKDYVIRNNTAARNDLSILTTGAAFFGTNLGIGVTPSVRLHVGVGGTGTQAEQVYVDSGSGAGGQPSYHLLRNSVLKATFGLAATTSSLISGSAINDLCVVNAQSILFSVNGGTDKHVSFAASLYTFGKGGTGTLREELRVDSGSGSGGHSELSLYRNSVFQANFAIPGSASAFLTGDAAGDLVIKSLQKIAFGIGSAMKGNLDGSGNWVLGVEAALATTATNGFVYIETCAGTPTGTPTAKTGMVPMVFDTTGVKLWIYTGGSWKGVVVA